VVRHQRVGAPAALARGVDSTGRLSSCSYREAASSEL
jgi:hypothetical protein